MTAPIPYIWRLPGVRIPAEAVFPTDQPAITTGTRPEHVFPTLTAEQIARIAARGKRRRVEHGEILVRPGDPSARMFVVVSGSLDIIRTSDGVEQLVVTHRPGMFSGESALLTGRPGVAEVRGGEPGEVIELDRDSLLAIIQTDSELSEILMRAFLLRRLELIARGYGDVILIGSAFCAGTLRIREFLTRNGHPYTYVDLDTDADVQAMLDKFNVSIDDVPVLICRGTKVLRNPGNSEIADCLGFNSAIDTTTPRDVIVIGAGPAGLSAAVYAASEGLDVLVIEGSAAGGQAGASSRIENYIGFPTGISGQDLAGRAFAQAEKFGAQIMIGKSASSLACGGIPFALEIDGNQKIPSRTVIIATGAAYRRLPLPNLSQFEGAGVYYAATFMEAQLCKGDETIVVGGGNAAGQAAVFLADSAARVLMLVRADGLAQNMSRYLVRRIEGHPKIELHTQSEITALEGGSHLERVSWRDNREGKTEQRAIRHVFLMMGAEPCTAWLNGCITLDTKGFVKTGPDLTPEDLAAAEWPLARAPFLLETSRPGIFAVGDVRAGNVKRVASAVGEGSIAVTSIHKVLAG